MGCGKESKVTHHGVIPQSWDRYDPGPGSWPASVTLNWGGNDPLNVDGPFELTGEHFREVPGVYPIE